MSDQDSAFSTLSEEAQIVRQYLEASMKPDPDLAATFVTDDVVITFTGGNVFNHPSGPTSINKNRYSWVKKKLGRFDVCHTDDGIVVYSIGTLYGEWPDGESFEGNRYIDRFFIRQGKIATMDVWNDSAERLLIKNSLAV
ncbi:MAG: nuclear transport factor 2 family protein [Granulosicoccus sp.]